MRADAMSLFNYGIYIEYKEPNMFRLLGLVSQPAIQMRRFTVSVLLQHPDSLNTISPTKMETFEDLAKSDVATFLANNLKYWDQWETVFASVDLKMNTLEDAAANRANIVDKLEQNFVSAANSSIPLVISV